MTKTGQNKTSKRLKAAKAAAMAMDGSTQGEIAKELGMSRHGTHLLLNSAEVKALLKRAEDRVLRMIDKACDTAEAAMDGAMLDMTNGLKSALAILKSTGVVKDKVDLSHSFPKATVIKRPDGSQVVLGTEKED